MILEILTLDNWYGISDNIEIAKGKHELPTTLKQAWKQQKRKWQKKE